MWVLDEKELTLIKVEERTKTLSYLHFHFRNILNFKYFIFRDIII